MSLSWCDKALAIAVNNRPNGRLNAIIDRPEAIEIKQPVGRSVRPNVVVVGQVYGPHLDDGRCAVRQIDYHHLTGSDDNRPTDRLKMTERAQNECAVCSGCWLRSERVSSQTPNVTNSE